MEHKSQQKLFFLGPKGEQRKLFQELIELINNDIIFWRRNFHPKDPPSILYRDLNSQDAQEFQDTLIQNLMSLLADLKMDLPFFSPRYMAHMTSDVSLPAILGYYAGLLYNPNNISVEASPVTLRWELEVGRQFAELFGFDRQKSFGHITSGGTIANIESVFYNRGCRFLPVAMGIAIKEMNLPWPHFLSESLWESCNVPLEKLPRLLEDYERHLQNAGVAFKLNEYTLSHLGERSFWQRAGSAFKDETSVPLIIVPANAHYSWSKASHLTAIGRENCFKVRMDRHLRMDVAELENALALALKARRPVVQTVCVLGSTEFGSFDALDAIVFLINKFQAHGLYSPIHLDAAYGGYFKTMFEPGPGTADEARSNQLALPQLHQILSATRYADSITVDPHKLGFTPYGAGVFLTRHGFTKEWIAEDADYCLEVNDNNEIPLGRYILEGSKPGASAASVYFSNKVIPLNSDGYGGHLFELMQTARNFYSNLIRLNEDPEFRLHFQVRALTLPDSNVVTFFIIPKNEALKRKINELNEELITRFFPRPSNHIQDFDYFVSKTKLHRKKLIPSAEDEIFEGLDESIGHVQLFRMVFTNQWSQGFNHEGLSFQQDFLNKLRELCLNKILP